ncbi:hypothetical protein glysoja_023470 [Glycine soja]|nr:hypothetical protein glysoja_023470 [Glycine soja]
MPTEDFSNPIILSVSQGTATKKGNLQASKRRLYDMVNATKGVFISCDIPMAQYIINMNASLPVAYEVDRATQPSDT